MLNRYHKKTFVSLAVSDGTPRKAFLLHVW